MKNTHPYRKGDHVVICDKCKAQRYRSQCSYTWDGFLMCHQDCWDPKHPIFMIPPVYQDPYPVYDTRPDQIAGTETYIDTISGMITSYGNTQKVYGSTGWKYGEIDSPPDYWS